MRSVSQMPNLKQLCKPPGGTEGLLEAVVFKKTTIVCDDEQIFIIKRECLKGMGARR